jgi:hypothetical protein
VSYTIAVGIVSFHLVPERDVKSELADSFCFSFFFSLIGGGFCFVKGTVSRDFRLLFFFLKKVSAKHHEYTIRAVSNFVENSRRYSQLKVNHRWKKIFNQAPPPNINVKRRSCMMARLTLK